MPSQDAYQRRLPRIAWPGGKTALMGHFAVALFAHDASAVELVSSNSLRVEPTIRGFTVLALTLLTRMKWEVHPMARIVSFGIVLVLLNASANEATAAETCFYTQVPGHFSGGHQNTVVVQRDPYSNVFGLISTLPAPYNWGTHVIKLESNWGDTFTQNR